MGNFCIDAPSGNSHCLQKYPGGETTVKGLKDIFQEETSIPADQIDFFFNGLLLEDNKTLMDYGIFLGSKISFKYKEKKSEIIPSSTQISDLNEDWGTITISNTLENSSSFLSEETQEQTEIQSQEETQLQTEIQSQEETQEQTEAQSQEETQEQTEAQSQTETQEQTEIQSQTETQEQTEIQSQTETQEQTEIQSQSETQAQTVPQSQAETQSQTEIQSQAETQSQTVSQSQEETQSQTVSQSQEETQAQTVPQSQEETQAQTVPQLQEETQAQTVSQSQAEIQAQTEIQSQTTTQAQTEVQSQATTQAQTVSQSQEETETLTKMISILPEKSSYMYIDTTLAMENNLEETLVVLFGFSHYKLEANEISFYIYFVSVKNFLFSQTMSFHVIINSDSNFRLLQNTLSFCNKVENDNIKVKYLCNYKITNSNIKRIGCLEDFSFIQKNVKVISLTPLSRRYINDLQNIKDVDLFEYKIYILNNAINNIYNNNLFNISGILANEKPNFGFIDLVLIMNSRRENEIEEEANCKITEISGINYTLSCQTEGNVDCDLQSAVSYINNNDILLINFYYNTNSLLITEAEENIYTEYFRTNSGISNTSLFLIIFFSLFFSIIIFIAFLFIIRKKFNQKNKSKENNEANSAIRPLDKIT